MSELLRQLHRSLTSIYDLKGTVCEQINSRARVNRLPNELLMEVFKHALHEADPTICLNVSESARVETRPLLWLTHVCRRWRSIALAHPLLWRRIDTHNAAQLHGFALHRSYPGPVSLFVNVHLPNVSESDDRTTLRFVLLCTHRLRRLDAAYGLKYYNAYLHFRLLHLPCPNLECLTVTNYLPTVVLQGEVTPIVVSRKSLFQGGLSRLRAFAISPIADWLPANPLPALTHLFLFFRWRNDLRMSHILSFLAGSPLLEMVHLSQFALLPEEQPNEHIPLPHLKHILFSKKSLLPSALALLRRLVIPSSARTYVGCFNVHSQTDGSILPVLPSTSGADHLTIVTKDTSLQLIASGRASNSCFWLSAHESANSHGDVFATWFTHLPAMFPLSNLTSLQLRLDIGHPGSTVSRILRSTPRLTTLEIMFCLFFGGKAESSGAENSLASVCHTLCLNVTDTDTDPPPEPQLCPALHMVTIVLESNSSTPLSDYTRWLTLIRTMVHARARMGRPLRQLAVKPMHDAAGAGARQDVIDAVHEAYASLAAAPGVEEFVLHGPSEEPIAFAEQGMLDWGEVERYWTVAEEDRPRFHYP